MDPIDKRRHPRHRVRLEAELAQRAPAPVTAVIDLSESGAGLEWSSPSRLAVGTQVRLRFLLAGQQSLEVDGLIAHFGEGRLGIEFLPAQQAIVSQLLAEARSDD